MMTKLLLHINLLLPLLLQDCRAYFYPPLIWHKDNCAFRQLQENTNSNGTKEYYIPVIPRTGMNVVCPNYVTVNSWLSEAGLSVSNPTLLENMWLVDKQGYDNCAVNEKGDPNFNKLFLICNKPQEIKYKSFIFHPYLNDEEPKFRPGHHYYFISTSRGYRKELATRKVSGSYGSCQRYHMKLHIYVCDPKKEDCVWEIPRCDPPADLQRDMLMIDGKLPAPTRPPVKVRKWKTKLAKRTRVIKSSRKLVSRTPKENRITEAPTDNSKEGDRILCSKNGKGPSIHLILNFVLGGVALFMAIVIIILAGGLTKRSKETKEYQLDRPISRSSSVYEPNKHAYIESVRYTDIQSPMGHRPSTATPYAYTLPHHLRTNYSQATPSTSTPPTYDGRVFTYPDVSVGDKRDERGEASSTTSCSNQVQHPAGV